MLEKFFIIIRCVCKVLKTLKFSITLFLPHKYNHDIDRTKGTVFIKYIFLVAFKIFIKYVFNLDYFNLYNFGTQTVQLLNLA